MDNVLREYRTSVAITKYKRSYNEVKTTLGVSQDNARYFAYKNTSRFGIEYIHHNVRIT